MQWLSYLLSNYAKNVGSNPIRGVMYLSDRPIQIHSGFISNAYRVRSLVVSDLCQPAGSVAQWFSTCVSYLVFNYCRGELSAVIAWLIREAGGSGTKELKMASPFTRCPVNRECHVKENPDRKKKRLVTSINKKVNNINIYNDKFILHYLIVYIFWV